jgi:hypothetical protein
MNHILNVKACLEGKGFLQTLTPSLCSRPSRPIKIRGTLRQNTFSGLSSRPHTHGGVVIGLNAGEQNRCVQESRGARGVSRRVLCGRGGIYLTPHTFTRSMPPTMSARRNRGSDGCQQIKPESAGRRECCPHPSPPSGPINSLRIGLMLAAIQEVGGITPVLPFVATLCEGEWARAARMRDGEKVCD